MKQQTLLVIPILALLSINILASTASQADWDNSQYINYNGYNYLVIGTGNLGLSNDLKSFTSPWILDQWLYKPLNNEFDMKSNLATRLTAIDFIHGVTEGNIAYNKNTKKWILTNYFISHIEPSGSNRTVDNLGAFNVGLTSTNCYIDRPQDTVLNPICDQIFLENKTSQWGVGSFDNDRKRFFFHDTRLPLSLSNYKAITIRKNARLLMDHVNSQGMSNQSTSIKLFYIDQINQLGLDGAKKLVTLDKKYLSYTKTKLLQVFKKLGVTDNNNIVINKSNGTFNLNNMSVDIIRLMMSRMQYFNALNSDNEFDSKQDWIKSMSKNNGMTQQQMMAGDAFRRYLLMPQSIQEFNEMEMDAYRMDYELKKLFRVN